MRDLLKTAQVNAFKEQQAKGKQPKDMTIHERFPPTNNVGSISERAYKKLAEMKADN